MSNQIYIYKILVTKRNRLSAKCIGIKQVIQQNNLMGDLLGELLTIYQKEISAIDFRISTIIS